MQLKNLSNTSYTYVFVQCSHFKVPLCSGVFRNSVGRGQNEGLWKPTCNKKLSCRKETVGLPRGSVLAKI